MAMARDTMLVFSRLHHLCFMHYFFVAIPWRVIMYSGWIIAAKGEAERDLESVAWSWYRAMGALCCEQ